MESVYLFLPYGQIVTGESSLRTASHLQQWQTVLVGQTFTELCERRPVCPLCFQIEGVGVDVWWCWERLLNMLHPKYGCNMYRKVNLSFNLAVTASLYRLH